jgi:CMP-N-acetylneuraminic acid synthetase
MEILGIIPVRKNSKGIPQKNIQKINGISLVEHTIRTAKKSKKISRLILSTDSSEIAKMGRKLGVEVPFIRPKKFAKSNSSSLDVITHALKFLKINENYEPDIILILQVTSPLRQLSSIDKSVSLLQNSNATSVLGVSTMKQNPFIAFTISSNNFLKPYQKNFQKFFQRQQFPKFYYPSGSIYIFWKKTLKKYGNFYGPRIKPLIVSKEESIDIDDIFDLFVCENIMKNWNNYKKKFLKKGVKF